MAEWFLKLKNNGVTPVEIRDLGITVDATSEVVLSSTSVPSQFSYGQVTESENLKTLVGAGTLVINDNIGDLSAANGVKYLTRTHLYDLQDRFYTKSEMQTTGQSQINYDNITNRPPHLAPEGWYRPVKYIVSGIGLATPPVGPDGNSVYVDDAGNYMRYNPAVPEWQDIGDVTNGDRVIDLSDSGTIKEYTVDTWVSETMHDAYAVVVNQYGGGSNPDNATQHTYDLPTTTWFKTGDADFTTHLNGQAGRHQSTEINIATGRSNIGVSADTSLDTAFGAIETNVNGSTLDRWYDGGGSGLGRTITADSGAVKVDRASATNASFEITPKATAPSTGLAGGQFDLDAEGRLYIYDATRSKFLSVERFTITFGRRGLTKKQYLGILANTSFASELSGIRLPRNATLTAMTLQYDTVGTGSAMLRINGSETNTATISVSAADGAVKTDFNVDLVSSDRLQAYNESTTGVDDPVLLMEFAYRR